MTEAAPAAPVRNPRTSFAPPPRRPVHLAAVGAGVLLVLVVGVVAFRAFTGGSGGAGSPEAAVRDLGEAVSKRDVSAALTLLPPGEVRSLKRVYSDATGKASKAGLLRASDPFGGIDLKVTGLQFDIQKPAKDVATVTIRGGRLNYTLDEKSAEAPVRAFLVGEREEAQREGSNWGTGSYDLAESDAGLGAIRLVTLRQRGRWYVSPAYSALETWREANGLPNANFDLDVSKGLTGAESPEAAFQNLASAAQSLDAGKLIDLLNPDELGGAARRYRQAIVTGTADFFSDWKSDVTFRVNDSRPMVRNKKGGSADVVVLSASGIAAADGDSARWSLDGTCLNVIGSDGDRDNDCLAELDPETGLSSLAEATDGFFVSVTSYRDRWYISPVQTALRYAELLLDRITERQVLAMFGLYQYAEPTGTIAADTPVKGSLERGAYGVYTFDVSSPGPVLACEARAGADDLVDASVFKPDGRPTDYFTSDIYNLDENGRYRVVVRSEDPRRKNDFEVVMKPVAVQDVSLPGDASGDVGASCDAKILRFNASRGDHVLIQGTLPDSRPTIFDAKGNYEASGRVFTPDETGTFLLAITDGGRYSVHLERATGNFLARSSTVQGTVARSGVAEYQLYATAREQIRVSVRGSGSFDGKMDIVSPSGTTLASADDTNGRDPAITYTFSTDGIYRVRVSGYDGMAGSFSVSVS